MPFGAPSPFLNTMALLFKANEISFPFGWHELESRCRALAQRKHSAHDENTKEGG